jgi:hypothetical protein
MGVMESRDRGYFNLNPDHDHLSRSFLAQSDDPWGPSEAYTLISELRFRLVGLDQSILTLFAFGTGSGTMALRSLDLRTYWQTSSAGATLDSI